jgi:hypothetical protein
VETTGIGEVDIKKGSLLMILYIKQSLHFLHLQIFFKKFQHINFKNF